MKVKCNNCDNEFELDVDSVASVTINNIDINYFECDICKSRYITSCIDDYILKEQRNLKKLKDKINTVSSDAMKKSLLIKANKKLNHLKTHSDRLKKEVEKLLTRLN